MNTTPNTTGKENGNTVCGFVQRGDWHCFTCHKTFPPPDYCECEPKPTPCTEKCGKWFKPQSTNKWEEELKKKFMEEWKVELMYTEREMIANYWIDEISTLLTELEKEVEKLKISRKIDALEHIAEISFNSALSQVLELIKLKKRE